MRAAGFDRSEVIEMITNAFWENGYEATSIGVLEEATGLKRQSLYNAFGNKDAMFDLALEHYEETVSARLIATLKNPDPYLALVDFFAGQAEFLLDRDKPAGCLVAGGQQELANREFTLGRRVNELIEEQYTALLAAFEGWQKAGRLKSDADPATLAAIVMAQLRGQSVLGRSPAATELVGRVAKGLPDLFRHYTKRDFAKP